MRNNQVILDGKIYLRRVYLVKDRLAVEMVVETDQAVLGGHHRVVCESDLALEALAFVITTRAHKSLLTATIYGWLWSADTHSRVIAQEIHFHVSPVERDQAVGALKHLRASRGLPEMVPVNGWQVRVREVLADALDGAPV